LPVRQSLSPNGGLSVYLLRRQEFAKLRNRYRSFSLAALCVNPNGRPKGSVNLKTDLRNELSEQIRIREGDRSLKVSKQRAMLKALVAKALKGDARAANVVLTLVGKLFEPEAVAEQVPALTSDDQAILERFLARRIADQDRQT